MSQERLSIGRNDGSPLKWKMFREPLALNKRSKKICVWSVLQAVSGRGLYWHANYKSPEEIWQICARLGRVMRFCNLCQALIPMSIETLYVYHQFTRIQYHPFLATISIMFIPTAECFISTTKILQHIITCTFSVCKFYLHIFFVNSMSVCKGLYLK